MDIKSVVRNVIPLARSERVQSSSQTMVRTEDRDANGQSSDGSNPERRKLTDLELAAALEQLRELPGVQQHGLKIRSEVQNEATIVFVEDQKGHVIRRITEGQLLDLLDQKDRKSGNLLNRAL